MVRNTSGSTSEVSPCFLVVDPSDILLADRGFNLYVRTYRFREQVRYIISFPASPWSNETDIGRERISQKSFSAVWNMNLAHVNALFPIDLRRLAKCNTWKTTALRKARFTKLFNTVWNINVFNMIARCSHLTTTKASTVHWHGWFIIHESETIRTVQNLSLNLNAGIDHVHSPPCKTRELETRNTTPFITRQTFITISKLNETRITNHFHSSPDSIHKSKTDVQNHSSVLTETADYGP